jgi:hypothetical protein
MRKSFACLLKAAVFAAGMHGVEAAQLGIEERAAKVCGGIAKLEQNFQGALKIDDLTVRGDGSGTMNLRREGVDLGKVTPYTFREHKDCLIEVMKLLSRIGPVPAPQIGSPPKAASSCDSHDCRNWQRLRRNWEHRSTYEPVSDEVRWTYRLRPYHNESHECLCRP